MADYIIRALDNEERNAFGSLFTELGEPYGASFEIDRAAYNTQDTGTNKRFFHINNAAGDAISKFELRTINGDVVWSSTSNNPIVPRVPVDGEDPIEPIAAPSISNLSYEGGGTFTGSFDVSVLVFFSWDVGDPWKIDLW